METIRAHLRAGLDYLFQPFAWLLLACRVTPNQVSLMGILLNLITAWLIIDGQLLLAGLMYLLAGGLDLLDGVLARLAKMATRFGAFLDSTADRISEGVVFAAIAYHFASHGQSVEAAVAVLALLGSLLVSYTRARAEGLGLQCKVGIVTRAERVVLVAFGLMFGLLPEAIYCSRRSPRSPRRSASSTPCASSIPRAESALPAHDPARRSGSRVPPIAPISCAGF